MKMEWKRWVSYFLLRVAVHDDLAATRNRSMTNWVP